MLEPDVSRRIFAYESITLRQNMRHLHILMSLLCIVPSLPHRLFRTQVQKKCNTPNGSTGTCVSLKHCPEVLTLFTRGHHETAKSQGMALRQSCRSAITQDNYPVVCCLFPINESPTLTSPQTPWRSPKCLEDGATSAVPTHCFTLNGSGGTCVSLKHCPEVVTLFVRQPQDGAKRQAMVLRERCGSAITADNYPVVCCQNPNSEVPTTHSTPPSISRPTTLPQVVPPTTPSEVPTIRSEHPSCQGPDGVSGSCKPLKECDFLLDRLKENSNNETLREHLRVSNRICGSRDMSVCCASFNSGHNSGSITPAPRYTGAQLFLTENEGCGIVQQPSTKVVGGTDSSIGAWPWIALIGYDVWSYIPFKCGGTLITARNVITAAHCIKRDLSFVRLGEYDLSTETETQHVDVNVANVVAHPGFGRDHRHDVAVLFLEKSVEFTDLIRPICMPTSAHLMAKSYVASTPFVAGWGRTMQGGNAANVLQQLQIPVLENSVCRKSYKANRAQLSEEQFDESVLCVGYLEGGRDTCQGDSGGPLMIPEPHKGITRYYLIGIVSYGIGCARIGVPGIYTSTRYFMDWITDTIANGSS